MMEGKVIVFTNLEQWNLAGYESNGMVMCAIENDNQNFEAELIRPEADAPVGAKLVLE